MHAGQFRLFTSSADIRRYYKDITISSLCFCGAVCPLCGDYKVELVLHKGIQVGRRYRWLGPLGLKQVLFLWRVLVSEKPCFVCRVRTSGPKSGSQGNDCKTRKEVQAVSVHDYLSWGELYISKKCSNTLGAGQWRRCVQCFSILSLKERALSVDGGRRMKSKMLIITSAVPLWSVLEKWSPTASGFFCVSDAEKVRTKSLCYGIFGLSYIYCFSQVLHVIQ